MKTYEEIAQLKMENAYLRVFIDGDPKNNVTLEKIFFQLRIFIILTTKVL